MMLNVSFRSEDQRWEAVRTRDAAADGRFVYAVTTTGVFCRPTCRSRQPRIENVRFFDTPSAAVESGFRPCRRCAPMLARTASPHAETVLRACRAMEAAEEPLSLRELADRAGLSPFHFQRVFKQCVGITPKQFAMARRTERFRKELRRSKTVTEAIYGAGFNSPSRAYEKVEERLGMPPNAFRKGGTGVSVHYATVRTELGTVLIAGTERGVCSIEFGGDVRALRTRLAEQFPRACLTEGGEKIEQMASRVADFVASPTNDMKLPLDLQGTVFQQRVWRALQRIRVGRTATYKEVAESIGAPRSARAVARACAQNPVALAVPCHRVIGADGELSGYRWGIARKRELLNAERAAAGRGTTKRSVG